MSVNLEPNTLGVLYFYHNSLVIGGDALSFSTVPTETSTEALRNFWFINNISSSGKFYGRNNFPTPRSHFRYNWAGGTFPSSSNWPPASTNILAPGKSLWVDRINPKFELDASSPARNKGIDLSKTFILDTKTLGPFPGMKPGYFSGASPDLGAVQFGSSHPAPASPTGLLLSN